MTNTARSIEQEVFDRERVRITVAAPAGQELPHSYSAMFPKPLPDTAELHELLARVDRCLGAVLYGVINPLGSPTKISGNCNIGNLRAYYAPRTSCKAVRNRLGEILSKLFQEAPKALS